MDIRKAGSKSTGATNVVRLCGIRYGISALILDLLKGVLVAFLTFRWGIPIIVSSLAVVGHNWSPFLKWAGGKGVATTLGLLSVLSWKVFLITLAIWILVAFLTSYVSVSSMSALIGTPLILYLYKADWQVTILMLFLGLLTVFQHRKNIDRLINGKENKLNFGSG